LHFGLGPRDRVDRIEIRWTDGRMQVLEHIAADRRWLVREGADAAVRLP
jgi:hypothetical protein